MSPRAKFGLRRVTSLFSELSKGSRICLSRLERLKRLERLERFRSVEEETIHGHGGKRTALEDADGTYPFRQGGIGAATEISRAHSGRTCRGATQGPLSRLYRRSAPGIQSKNVSVLDQLSRPGRRDGIQRQAIGTSAHGGGGDLHPARSRLQRYRRCQIPLGGR